MPIESLAQKVHSSTKPALPFFLPFPAGATYIVGFAGKSGSGLIDARPGPPGYKMTREGYGKAYQGGYDATLRFLLSRGVPWESAAEVTQEAWAKGWERIEQLRNENMVLSWVNTIALNAHRRRIRDEPAWQAVPEIGTMPAINLAAIDIARILRVCCPGDRKLLGEQLNGLTPREIARARGVTELAVRVRLVRARRAARLRIEQVRRSEPAKKPGIPA